MKFRLYEVKTLSTKTPGHLRGGWSHFEKKLGILPGALYGRVIRDPQGERATYLEAPFYPVETMPLPELLDLPACVYFANIGPRLHHSRTTCGSIRTILANINRHYLLSATWTHTSMRELLAVLEKTPRSALRLGPITGSGAVDAFYECLNARNLLPIRSSGK